MRVIVKSDLYGDIEKQVEISCSSERIVTNVKTSEIQHKVESINIMCLLAEMLISKFRKLRETLSETIRSETQKWGRSTTIIGIPSMGNGIV